MSPTARQSASNVRASALRRCALIFEKACSIGLQTLGCFLALVDGQVVEDHHIAFSQRRRQLRLDVGVER
jgi:hypothetical protein